MTHEPTAGIEPVIKERVVSLTVEQAFARFTEGIATWWPMATHSVGESETETVVLEGGIGGRLYERQRSGTECEWGRVTAWEPSARVAFTWHPGRDASTAMQVDVRFTSVAEGTRLRLEHTGWEVLGAEAVETRNGYVGGWEGVLNLYVAVTE